MMRRRLRPLTFVLVAMNSLAAAAFAHGEEAKPAPADRSDELANSIGMKLVLIPAGEFLMGAEEDQDSILHAFPYVDPALLPRVRS